MVQASGDTLAKTLNLVNRQLEHLNSRMDKIEAETKSGNGGNWQVNRQPAMCFHCNRPGHYMRDCYQRQTENRGTGSNHRGQDRGNGNDYTYGNQRFSGGNNQPKEETEIKHVKGGNIVGSLVPTVAHVDPNLDVFYSCTLPLIDIVIGGIKCMALIGSGATMNLIDKSIFHKLKNFVVIEVPPINLKTLSNESLSTKFVIKTSVEIKNVKLPGHFVLAEADLSPSFNVILGLEFLNLHKFTLDCDKNLLKNDKLELKCNFERINHSTGFLVEENYSNERACDKQRGKNLEIKKCKSNGKTTKICENENNKIMEVYFVDKFDKSKKLSKLSASVLKGTTIPPLEKKYIKLRVIDDIRYLKNEQIVFLEKNTISKNFLLARAVAQIENDDKYLALVWNISDGPIHLNKNMALADIEPICEQKKEDFVNVIHEGMVTNINWKEKLDLNHLNQDDKTKLLTLLDRYKSVVAQSVSDLGSCDIVEHEINLTDKLPIRQKPYRVPYALKSEMKHQINTLLDAGTIQPSNSAYSAPVMLVKKRDGSYRLVADLRKLNEKTIPDNFPLPNLTEMVEMLSGARYFTSMDLTSGFHQMKMHPSSAHLTGISTEFGLLEFKRMPFGLKNASASFQRLMSIVLAGLSELQINVYIDDVIVASKTVQEHL
ncbi:retrovirus-related Pol polyprotein from transposon 17.6 [Caerostris darwini]|uniref:Retrovirus-related Pol polyprotein from transposon 17.6 n=1 Tax=Caerostris darwini TaxID=1538125 RepID=A0AAV4NYI6_9ARAC|nr:retrovirus-related Pol polyprotein from transposon 17.6 [Caerostris darwini]